MRLGRRVIPRLGAARLARAKDLRARKGGRVGGRIQKIPDQIGSDREFLKSS